MDKLPGHLLDKVLFKTDLKTLGMLCCTNTSFQSHIYDPSFVSEYYSQIRSSLLYISCNGSNSLGCHHPDHDSSRSSLKTKYVLTWCHILGYCSGLVLLFMVDRLCVANPHTKKFRFLTLSDPCPRRFLRRESRNNLGLAVNQIDPYTKSFKLVYLFERERRTHETSYGFEIISGNSWTCSKRTLTCHSSNLDGRMKNPVYLDGSLHWLRNDGSIIAFNPETKQARLIHTQEFPNVGLGSATLFALGDNSLTLVSTKEGFTYIYGLKNILSDSKWVLVKQIKNGVTNKNGVHWYVGAYDGKCLVLGSSCEKVVQIYDLSANKWIIMGSDVPVLCCADQDFFLFTPTPNCVVGLDEEILACGDRRISCLRSIMTLVDRSSPENQLMEMTVEEKETELKSPFGMLLYEKNTNKRRRKV